MRFVESVKSYFRFWIDQKSVSLSDPLAFELFGSTTTIAGPSINPATAMRVPAVNSAIALISGAIGSLPAKVYLAADTGGKGTANTHPAYRLVHDEANDWTSAGTLRTLLTADALLHDKGGFAFANRVDGRVQEFIRLDPNTVTVKQDAVTGEPVYVVRNGATSKTYAFTDILHVAAPGGIAPINAAREAIALATVLEQHAARLFARGGRPSGVLRFPKSLGDDTAKRMSLGWHAAHSGDASGRTAILEEGGEFQPLTFNSVDAQFEQMRRFQIEDIARAFRVPPHLLFELSRATLNNSEEMGQMFLTFSLRPWLDAWEWALARVLLSPEERAAGFYVEFIVDDLLTANAATRATTYAQYRAMGAMTANEVRAGLNLPAIDGGDTLANPNITPGAPANDNVKNETVSDSTDDRDAA